MQLSAPEPATPDATDVKSGAGRLAAVPSGSSVPRTVSVLESGGTAALELALTKRGEEKRRKLQSLIFGGRNYFAIENVILKFSF